MRKIILPVGLLIGVLLISLAIRQPAAGQAFAAAPAWQAQPTSTPAPLTDTLTELPATEAGWSVPGNLSRSGGATDPQLVIDSNGRYHALWQDAIDGFMYAAGDGANWTVPVPIEAPFFTRRFLTDPPPETPTPLFRPQLIADAAGAIHAFWVDDSGPGEPTLYHSQVAANQLTQFDAWSPRATLDTGVVAFDAIGDAAGQIHLATIRNAQSGDRPAGVYYAQRAAGGAWSAPTPRYFSRYLRLADGETANVQVGVDNGQVYVAWDDAGREQVFIARSPNGGVSWDAPQEMDRRMTGDAPDSEGPGHIRIGFGSEGPIVVWQAGHAAGERCTQYYRFSTDEGVTWSIPERLSESLPGCLDTAEFIDGDVPLLMGTTSINDLDQRAYLLAWDGTRWSAPKMQPELASFNNIETNQLVMLRCLRAVERADTLSVIGCDAGAGGDIWWLTRPLADVDAWFVDSSVWRGPERIAAMNVEPGGMSMVADESGATHLFWYETGGTTIIYSRHEDGAWSPATPVMATRDGMVSALSVAAGNGRLYMVWRDSTGLYFSQAGIRQPTEWSAPAALTDATSPATAPMILSASNELLIAYALQLNEQRGVYLIRSSDTGATWSQPSLIFDGAAAGWEMVDQPILAQSGDGRLHAQIMRRSYPPELTPLDLLYTRSADNGLTWTPYQASGAITAMWSGLYAASNGELHRLWTEAADDRMAVRHMVSADSGLTWSDRQQIAILPAGPHPGAATDTAGRLQVVAMDGGRLLNWYWDDGSWHPSDPLTTNLGPGGLLGAVVDRESQLMVALSVAAAGSADGAGWYGMSRQLDGPAEGEPVAPPPQPTLVGPVVTTTPPAPAATATPEPTPTVILDSGPPNNGILSRVPGANSRIGQLGLGIVPAALVVVVVVIVALRAVRMGRKP